MTKTDPTRVFSIAWYDSSQWGLLTKVAADRADLDDTFEEWRANALGVEREIQAAGHAVSRVAVDVAKLEAWCREKHVANTSSARAKYVAQLSSSSDGDEA